MSDFSNFFDDEDYKETTRSYSGRGMFGKQCVGITVASNQIGSTIFDIGLKIGDYKEGDVTDCSLEEFVECFRNVKWDNMGLDYVIYFPDIEWDEDFENEENVLQLSTRFSKDVKFDEEVFFVCEGDILEIETHPNEEDIDWVISIGEEEICCGSTPKQNFNDNLNSLKEQLK